MTGASLTVPALLWRGELRVQGLLLRRPLLMAAQIVVGVAILAIVVLRARDVLSSSEPVHYLNVAIVVLSLGVLMSANVTLLGERSGTLPWQLQRWASSLPMASSQVARLIAVFSTMRSGLLTLSLLGAFAIGALTAAPSLTSATIIVASALLLPLLPVAVGLQWARRRGTSVSPAFTLVLLGLGVSATTVPLPLTSGLADNVVRWISLPGMMLAGRTDPGATIVFLAAWTGIALVLMRPAALSLQDSVVARGFGTSIWRLSRIPATNRSNRLAFDIAVHRVGLTDLVEILFLGAVSCSIVALQVFATGTILGAAALSIAVSAAAATATLAGYVQMRATIRTDDTAEDWIRTLPVSARALSVSRHVIGCGGALLAMLPVMVLAATKASAISDPAAILIALWAGMSVWSLTGWFAAYLPVQGFLKLVGGYALFGWYAGRAVLGAAILVGWNQPAAVAALFAADIVIGLMGQWLGAQAASRERGR